MIMDHNTSFFNYRLLEPTVRICSANVSGEANRLYLENRYPKEIICRNPCTSMKIQVTLQDKTLRFCSLSLSDESRSYSRGLQQVIPDGPGRNWRLLRNDNWCVITGLDMDWINSRIYCCQTLK